MGSEYANPYPQAQDQWQTALQKMAVLYGKWASGAITVPGSGSGMVVPENDEQVFAYYAATNNVQTITYKQGGQQVAVQNFEYRNGGVADDDDITRIAMTLS